MSKYISQNIQYVFTNCDQGNIQVLCLWDIFLSEAVFKWWYTVICSFFCQCNLQGNDR